MTEEDFLAWRENPVTRWFMKAFKNSAALCEAEWKDGSWITGQADQAALDVLKAKATAYAAVEESDFTDIQARQE